ncbi:MAG: hypothetical protein WAU15_13145 [Nitrosomonas sp.]
MNKTELIEAVATRSQTTKNQTTAMLNELPFRAFLDLQPRVMLTEDLNDTKKF